MPNLSTIISTYEEKFDEKIKHFFSEKDPIHGEENKKDKLYVQSLFRQFAADLVREAFEATKVEKDNGINPHTGMPDYLEFNKGFTKGANAALSEVEAKQQEFMS